MKNKQEKPWEHLYEKSVLWKQIAEVALAVLTLFAIVIVVDFFIHFGKDWSQSLLVKMIVERRLALPFFR